MRVREFQALYPNFDIISSTDSFFGSVKVDFNEYAESGFFQDTKVPAIYIYRIETPNRKYEGVLLSLSMDDYTNGKVIKHEKTLSAKEQKSMQLLLSRKAMIKPVLLTCPKVNLLSQLYKKITTQKKPFYTVAFENDESRHTLWQIKDKRTINRIIQIMDNQIPKCYISDGHHRFEVMERIRRTGQVNKKQYNHILAAIFSFDQVDIFDYNRVLEVLDEMSPTHFIARISEYCSIKPIKRAAIPLLKYEMTMYLKNEWYRLKWKKSVIKSHTPTDGPNMVLDVSLFNDIILKSIVGMEEVRSDLRVKYVSGIDGLQRLQQMVNKNSERVGFCLHAIDLKEFKSISDADKVLPPKSTWFEPRMKNGLVVQQFQ